MSNIELNRKYLHVRVGTIGDCGSLERIVILLWVKIFIFESIFKALHEIKQPYFTSIFSGPSQTEVVKQIGNKTVFAFTFFIYNLFSEY